MVTSKSLSLLNLLIFNFNFVLASPRKSSETASESFPFILFPSISRITSPLIKPAFAAGLSSYGCEIAV